LRVWVFILAAAFPLVSGAQSSRLNWGFDEEDKAIVTVLPFAGEEEAAALFHAAAMKAVTALGKYESRGLSASVFFAGTEIPTDMPPSRGLAPAARYALTGGVYGDQSGESYLQLWLWDMTTSTMIYSDDLLIYNDLEGALQSLPGLVEWLFSHIREVIVEAPEVQLPADWLFTLGLKTGLTPRWYARPGERIAGAQSLGVEGGLTAALRLGPLFSLRLELLLSRDDLVYRGLTAANQTYNEKLSSDFLTVPLFVRLNFKAGLFRLSPMAGLYAALPLGQTRYSDSLDRETSYSHSGVLAGFNTGLEAALDYGPGMIIAGLRYSGDFNNLVIDYNNPKNSEPDTSYRRDMFSFYVGYEFGFIDLNKKNRPATERISGADSPGGLL
jgi:hypothetical protein